LKWKIFDAPGACLGSGSFGSIFKCQQTHSKIEAAVKIINFKSEDHKKAEREVYISKLCDLERSPYILKIFDFTVDKNMCKAYIFMELCELGSLREYLNKQKGKRLPEIKALELFHQILLGLDVLHNDCSITHRDLKPDNILCDNEGNLKIADFGEATTNDWFITLCGTILYMPPEMHIEGIDKNCSVDVWAAGIILHEMIFGEIPFKTFGE